MTYGFSYAPYNNLEAFKNACTENTIAIMVEPVQGEGGVHPATKEFMQGLRKFCDEKGIEYKETLDFSADVINESDIIYMTRVQRERFTDIMEYERVKDLYTLHNAMLSGSKPNLKILHPLPRVNEIDRDVDDNPKAYYFEQARNGLYARQAIITRALGIDI